MSSERGEAIFFLLFHARELMLALLKLIFSVAVLL